MGPGDVGGLGVRGTAGGFGVRGVLGGTGLVEGGAGVRGAPSAA
jgi:hypothetical protein